MNPFAKVYRASFVLLYRFFKPGSQDHAFIVTVAALSTVELFYLIDLYIFFMNIWGVPPSIDRNEKVIIYAVTIAIGIVNFFVFRSMQSELDDEKCQVVVKKGEGWWARTFIVAPFVLVVLSWFYAARTG